MIRTYSLILLMLVSLCGMGQDFIVSHGDTVNRIDAQGDRYGLWSFYDEEGVKITVNFNHDIPGDTILYFEKNSLRFVYIKSQTDTIHYTYYDGAFSCSDFFTLTTINYCSDDSAIIKGIKRFIFYEIFPVYPGGQTAMIDYLRVCGSKFPEDQRGTVKVGFTIDETGRPSDIKVTYSENHKLDSHCIRAIQQMPRWQAGYQGGKVVSVPIVIPFACK